MSKSIACSEKTKQKWNISESELKDRRFKSKQSKYAEFYE